MPMLLSVDNLEESVSPPTILTGLIQFDSGRTGVTGVDHTVIQSSNGLVAYGDTIDGIAVYVIGTGTAFNGSGRTVGTGQADRASAPLIATAEPSAPFAVIEPSAPLTATEEPSLPLTVTEPSTPSTPSVPALPKVRLSASFTS